MTGAEIPNETTAIRDFSSDRTTVPDHGGMVASVRVACGDASASVIVRSASSYSVKKAAAFTPAEITAIQAAIDAAPAQTARTQAQQTIDGWPLEYKALILALIDALNVVRAKLPTPLPPITPAQALQAIRDKAGTL